jgi:hypothetical protein
MLKVPQNVSGFAKYGDINANVKWINKIRLTENRRICEMIFYIGVKTTLKETKSFDGFNIY